MAVEQVDQYLEKMNLINYVINLCNWKQTVSTLVFFFTRHHIFGNSSELLCISVFCALLLLCRIPLHECIMDCLPIFLLMDIWFVSSFWQLGIKLLRA